MGKIQYSGCYEAQLLGEGYISQTFTRTEEDQKILALNIVTAWMEMNLERPFVSNR